MLAETIFNVGMSLIFIAIVYGVCYAFAATSDSGHQAKLAGERDAYTMNRTGKKPAHGYSGTAEHFYNKAYAKQMEFYRLKEERSKA